MQRYIAAALVFVGVASAQTLRYNVGYTVGPYTDTLGNVWAVDTGCSGSNTSTANTIIGTSDQTLYRFAKQNPVITCSYQVTPGNYTVTLKFAEVANITATVRKFSIAINGTVVNTGFDTVADAPGGAPFTAVDKVYPAPNTGSTLTIVLTDLSTSGSPFALLNAVQIEPGLPTVFTGSTAVKTMKNGIISLPYSCKQGHTCDVVMLPGGSGTVTKSGSTAIYKAPAVVPRHGTVGGCPIFAHNNIFNMRVDGMPKHPQSDTFVASLAANTSVFRAPHYEVPGIAASPVTQTTPLVAMKDFVAFRNYNIPFVTPPSFGTGSRSDPRAVIQTAWGITGYGHGDNHWVGVLKDGPNQCQLSEVYQVALPSEMPYDWKAHGAGSAVCTDCNVDALAQFDNATFNNVRTGTGATVAMNVSLVQMQISASDLRAAIASDPPGTAAVKHGLGITFSNNAINGTTGVGVWPSVDTIIPAAHGPVPYGSRIRLPASFKICGDPDAVGLIYPACYDASIDTPVVLQQEYVKASLRTFKMYGAFAMDGALASSAWGIHTRTERELDPDFLAANRVLYQSKQLNGTSGTDFMLKFEVVDESGYLVSLDSNVVRDPAAQPETVSLLEDGVIKDYRDIAVMPPAIGGFQSHFNIAAGSAGVNLHTAGDVFATGLVNNTALVWSLHNCTTNCGTLNSLTGFYTPPVGVTAPTTVVFRVAAAEDPSVLWEGRVTTIPWQSTAGTAIFTRYFDSKNFVDSTGRSWWAYDNTGAQLNFIGQEAAALGGTALGNTYPDKVYWGGQGNESIGSIYVPNGYYDVTVLVNTGGVPSAANANLNAIELNGVVEEKVNYQAIGNWSTTNTKRGLARGPYRIQVTNGEIVVGWKIFSRPAPNALFSGVIITPASAPPPPPPPPVQTKPGRIVMGGQLELGGKVTSR
jgi:hypothetical protein